MKAGFYTQTRWVLVHLEIAEHALAHIEGSANEQAYRRTDYFERRRKLMQEWADYILGRTSA